jgi:glycosyltransferase involved in cell wall biosynthesis
MSISLLPVFLKGKSFLENNGDEKIQYVGRIDLFSWQLPRIISFFFEIVYSFFIVAKAKKKIAFFYNLEPQNILLVLFTRFILGMKTFIIVADYSYFTSKLQDRFFNLVLKNMTGAVSLNTNINCNTNSILLYGLTRVKDIISMVYEDNRKNILLSGSLGETTGLFVALEFARKNPYYNLLICGRPFRITLTELNKIIDEHSMYPNIKYFGVLDYEEYNEVLKRCSICLSLRNPNDIEHKYNFPSKILEYLSSSKIVLSTLNYSGVPENILLKVDFNSDSLAKMIDRINSLTFEEVQVNMLASSSFVKDNFTEDVVSQKIGTLL